MNEQVRTKLIELARKKRTITYQELSDACKLGLVMADSEFARAEIGRILGEVSAFEFHAQRPLLSALVISKGKGEQGDGFYRLCEELGYGSWKKLKNNITFDSLQINRCYNFLADDNNYNLYK